MTDPRLALLRNASFSTASTGYQSTAVHRLVDEAARRLERGEPIEIDASSLPRVSFGYDTEQVDALLRSLTGDDAPSTPEPAESAEADADVAAPAPVTDAPELDSRARDTMIDELRNVRFRISRRGGQGYAAPDVDDALDSLANKVADGTLTKADLHGLSFAMAGRGESGYEVSGVDEFIDSLQRTLDRSAPPRRTAPPTPPNGGGWLSKLLGR